jgi:hypothetical protein
MPEELILKTKIKRKSGWLYLLDKDGDVCRTKMCGIIQHYPPKYAKPEKILHAGIKRENWEKEFVKENKREKELVTRRKKSNE